MENNMNEQDVANMLIGTLLPNDKVKITVGHAPLYRLNDTGTVKSRHMDGYVVILDLFDPNWHCQHKVWISDSHLTYDWEYYERQHGRTDLSRSTIGRL